MKKNYERRIEKLELITGVGIEIEMDQLYVVDENGNSTFMFEMYPPDCPEHVRKRMERERAREKDQSA